MSTKLLIKNLRIPPLTKFYALETISIVSINCVPKIPYSRLLQHSNQLLLSPLFSSAPSRVSRFLKPVPSAASCRSIAFTPLFNSLPLLIGAQKWPSLFLIPTRRCSDSVWLVAVVDRHENEACLRSDDMRLRRRLSEICLISDGEQ
ncbi:unnamed protein product [Rodentolepis nana]|uniref:Uncharacterized protein n=1 Tax=Rodentolepis nana TaxID=102285 RepID=A0A0R3TDF8_RODNA|nr:unnamed protein product [Rodentolepis nana]